jgi:hypothetical protein
MAAKSTKYREETWPVDDGEHAITEFLGPHAGSQSPFGDEQEFPLPVERLVYNHPSTAERPNLAAGH